MSLSLNQVEELLATGGDTRTLDDLIDIVKNVSANVNGVTSDSTYLLYSGTILDDPSTVYASQAAAAIKKTGGGVDILSSDVGQLLRNSDVFNEALMRAIKLDVLGDAFANPSTYEELDELKTKQNLILHGKDGIGSDAPRVS